MRILVTGGRGKVGSEAAIRLRESGHSVTLTDVGPAQYGPQEPGSFPFLRADLTDYGATVAVIHKCRPEVVIHTAGIPDPAHDPPSHIFATNVVSTFNITEAIATFGVRRLVNTSSETAPGFVTAVRPFLPDYLPVDEHHPIAPQEGYALSKATGEQICDALVRRSDATAVSIRPSLVLKPQDYASTIPMLQARRGSRSFNYWSYVDTADLGDLIRLAAESDTAGHEVVYAAQPDNYMGESLADLLEEAYAGEAPPLRPLRRSDASGIDSSKAEVLLGWTPKLSWRDRVSS
jgi:UDP-glucose 4-epimerase